MRIPTDEPNLLDPNKAFVPETPYIQCARCGATALIETGPGLYWCIEEVGGCNRPSVPFGQSSNGTSSLEKLEPATPSELDLLDGLPATDVGNSRRLETLHAEDLRYIAEWGWTYWDGTRWVRDAPGRVLEFAKNVARSMIMAAAEDLKTYAGETIREEHGVPPKSSEDRKALARAKKLLKFAEASQSQRRLTAMLALAQSSSTFNKRPEDFDANPLLLNLQDCTIELATGEAKPHDRFDYITKVSPVFRNDSAQCPTWLAFLDRIMGKNEALISYLRRVVGYWLTGSTSEQVVFLLYGAGANGKSTFINTVLALLGSQFGSQANADSFLLTRAGPSNDIARLQSVRFVAAVEVGEGRRLNEILIKQLSGGDTITARFLYHESFEFKPQFKLCFASNHKPEIHGQDHAIWRRIRLIPFHVTIPKAEQDPKLASKLVEELPGILNWALAGCKEWMNGGLQDPPEVLEASQSYREEMDILGEFLAVNCTFGPAQSCEAASLYRAYIGWCESTKEKPISSNAFSRRLGERGLARARDRKGRRQWEGVTLTDMGVTMTLTEGYGKSRNPLEDY